MYTVIANITTGEVVQLPYTQQEQAEYDTKKALWDAGANDRKAAEVKASRTEKLKDCDWTQGVDVPQATQDKWSPYRQALRDVPAQAGFPWTVEWPVQP